EDPGKTPARKQAFAGLHRNERQGNCLRTRLLQPRLLFSLLRARQRRLGLELPDASQAGAATLMAWRGFAGGARSYSPLCKPRRHRRSERRPRTRATCYQSFLLLSVAATEYKAPGALRV